MTEFGHMVDSRTNGKLFLEMKTGFEMNYSTFTFVLDDIVQNIVDASIARGYVEVGNVMLKGMNQKDECVTRIYANSSATSSCLVYKCGSIPDSLQSIWTQFFIRPAHCKSCLVLSGLPLAAYNSDMTLGGLRVMFSSAVEDEVKEQFATCTPLETGRVVSGCTAAVLCEGEYNAVEVVVCLSLRGLSYTLEAAEMFESISSQVGRYLEVEDLTFSGNNALHAMMIKSDKFLSRTENMYV